MARVNRRSSRDRNSPRKCDLPEKITPRVLYYPVKVIAAITLLLLLSDIGNQIV
ncbi:MAG: hypothetical protein R2758_09740 [Bacteroidales bacterium]